MRVMLSRKISFILTSRKITLSFLLSSFLLLSLLPQTLYSREDEMWDFKKKKIPKKQESEILSGQVFLLWNIRLYQLILSDQQGDACNFSPSCSRFALSAIKREGALKGSLMAIDRLQRCNPWAWNYVNQYYSVKWIEQRGYKLCDYLCSESEKEKKP